VHEPPKPPALATPVSTRLTVEATLADPVDRMRSQRALVGEGRKLVSSGCCPAV
jgi:hypothetical protein